MDKIDKKNVCKKKFLLQLDKNIPGGVKWIYLARNLTRKQ